MKMKCPCCGTKMEVAPAGKLTVKQQTLLAFIKNYMRGHNGVPPSYDEMLEAMEVASKSGIHRLVHALRQRWHIRLIPNHARAIELVDGYAE